MRISSIIPVYNAAPYLRRAVESLLVTHDANLEIVIVDDGSTDGSVQLGEQLQQELPGVVRFAQHPAGENRGVSATRNLGFEVSTGEWLALLDADDYVLPHRFESARKILSSRLDVDGVYQLCGIEFETDQARQSWWNTSDLFGFSHWIQPRELIFELLRGQCWATSAIVFRRTLLNRTGLFDPHLKLAEDCHLWFRMAIAGNLIPGDLSQPVSVYWRHEDSAHQPSPRMRLPMVRAMTEFLKWMKANYSHDDRLSRVSKQITEYILQGIFSARMAGDRRLASHMAFESAYRHAPVLTSRKWYGQLLRIALGR